MIHFYQETILPTSWDWSEKQETQCIALKGILGVLHNEVAFRKYQLPSRCHVKTVMVIAIMGTVVMMVI